MCMEEKGDEKKQSRKALPVFGELRWRDSVGQVSFQRHIEFPDRLGGE